jgi:hypothetical protein
MLQLFPFVSWLAAATCVVMLVMLWATGESRRGLAIATVWLLAAGYCQFFAASPIISAVGRALLTLLAIGLIVRWRLTAP